MRIRMAIAAVLTAGLSLPAQATDAPRTQLKDPYASGMWDYHQINLLGDPEKIRFDDRIVLRAPATAEDAFNVPLMVDATAMEDVEKIMLSVDYGPIPHILTYYPGAALAKLSLRFKIDQGTAVRAAVQTSDGAWHVGSTYIDAAGGGCTAPATAYANADWEEKLGEIHGRLWPASGRARLIVDHPMDTGLADGIPVFIITALDFTAPGGDSLARIELREPVNEDPAFTLYFDPETLPTELQVRGRDNNGNPISGRLTASELN